MRLHCKKAGVPWKRSSQASAEKPEQQHRFTIEQQLCNCGYAAAPARALRCNSGSSLAFIIEANNCSNTRRSAYCSAWLCKTCIVPRLARSSLTVVFADMMARAATATLATWDRRITAIVPIGWVHLWNPRLSQCDQRSHLHAGSGEDGEDKQC